MFHFLHLRSRVLQTLILGLVVLTFYAYYRTTVTDERHFHSFAFQNIGRPFTQEVSQVHANATADVGSASAAKNGTPENSVNASQPHNTGNGPSSTVITVVSVSSSSHTPSSSSISGSSKQWPNGDSSSKAKVPASGRSNVGSHTISSSVSAARAIYVAGHTVTVPDKCPYFGRDMDLVIVIMSAPTHAEARTAIRQTWGHFGQRRDMSIVFMIGATEDAKVEQTLRKEQNMYDDMIRGKFYDSYSNLTLKTISTLEWVDNYCSEVKFVLKTDDDMFINVPRLLAFIDKHRNDKNVIFGRLAKKWKPIRNKQSKYYVSQAQYKQPIFPDFTTGPAYLLSSDIVHSLYEAALDQTYLKLEDVYVTGIVAHTLGIKRMHANEFLNRKISYSPCNVQKEISIHMVKYSEQFDLWKKLLDGKTKCK